MIDKIRGSVNIGTTIASVISGLCLLAASGAIKYAFDVKDELNGMKTSIEIMKTQLLGLQADDERDESQDRQLSRQWTIVSVHRDWINDLRVTQGKELVSWPASNWSSRRNEGQ